MTSITLFELGTDCQLALFLGGGKYFMADGLGDIDVEEYLSVHQFLEFHECKFSVLKLSQTQTGAWEISIWCSRPVADALASRPKFNNMGAMTFPSVGDMYTLLLRDSVTNPPDAAKEIEEAAKGIVRRWNERKAGEIVRHVQEYRQKKNKKR